jgi:hypothetical protein
LAAAFGVRPTDVRRVYSQWEPTSDDRAFLAAELPAVVKVSYSFHRPPARRDWGKPTPELGRVVGEFERLRFAGGDEQVGKRQGRSRRPWWQYWD